MDKGGTSFGSKKYDKTEKQFLQNTLTQKLPEKWLSKRPGFGGHSVYYLETWRAISIANEVFGFNGWSSKVVEISQDYLDPNQNGRFSCGISAIVRVSLKDGAHHEDIGYGTAENQKTKGKAVELAKKTAVSDALKRTLRNFGFILGLTIYDKKNVRKIATTSNKQNQLKEIPKNPSFKGETNSGNQRFVTQNNHRPPQQNNYQNSNNFQKNTGPNNQNNQNRKFINLRNQNKNNSPLKRQGHPRQQQQGNQMNSLVPPPLPMQLNQNNNQSFPFKSHSTFNRFKNTNIKVGMKRPLNSIEGNIPTNPNKKRRT